MYILQQSRYGGEWQPVDYVCPTENLEALKEEMFQSDSMGGRYDYRIVDESGKVYKTQICAYQSVNIDLCSDTWLEDIRRDYGVDKTIWKTVCENWLREHSE